MEFGTEYEEDARKVNQTISIVESAAHELTTEENRFKGMASLGMSIGSTFESEHNQNVREIRNGIKRELENIHPYLESLGKLTAKVDSLYERAGSTERRQYLFDLKLERLRKVAHMVEMNLDIELEEAEDTSLED